MKALRRIVVTGGPGGGKTAVLELARRCLPDRIGILPESARIILGGGFPRYFSQVGRRAAQRAIFHVQRELERVAEEEGALDTVLCDRGTLDGLAYWPGAEEHFFEDVQTTAARERARYDAVIHLRTPHAGYVTDNVRHESLVEAQAIDQRLLEIWHEHPRRYVVNGAANFLEKVQRVIEIFEVELEGFRADVASTGLSTSTPAR